MKRNESLAAKGASFSATPGPNPKSGCSSKDESSTRSIARRTASPTPFNKPSAPTNFLCMTLLRVIEALLFSAQKPLKTSNITAALKGADTEEGSVPNEFAKVKEAE